jgi:fructokinase
MQGADCTMILVSGEVLVDLATHDNKNLSAHLGGGPFNTARTLGRLDVPVAFVGRVSSDAFGRQVRKALIDDGVDDRWIVATDEPTTLALAEIDGNGSASYTFYLDGTSVPGLVDADVVHLPSKVDALHVGTLALVVEPFATTTEHLVERYRGSSLVFADPNVRPLVISDRAAYLARLDRIYRHADIVKVSDADLAWLAPNVSLPDAARRILALGPRLVLVTQGGDGQLIVGHGFAEHQPAASCIVVDTIGAGDSYSGGILAWWHDNGLPDLGDRAAAVAASAFGARVAAVTCSRAGADPPRRKDIH